MLLTTNYLLVVSMGLCVGGVEMEKNKSQKPYLVHFFPVPWMTLSNNPDLQLRQTYNHTCHRILSILWWREQRFPFNRLNNRPGPQRAFVDLQYCEYERAGASKVCWCWETGIKSRPWKPFHVGEGFEKKKGGENAGIPLRSHSPAVVQPERRDEAASANISQNRQRYIRPYLSTFIYMKTLWKRRFSVI